jgi:two-component system, sensor histidine kinase PdtaS
MTGTPHTRHIAALLIAALLSLGVMAQETSLDSVKALNEKADQLLQTQPDSSFLLANKAYQIAKANGLRSAEAVSCKYLGLARLSMNDADSALSFFFRSLDLFRSLEGKEKGQINALHNIADAYISLGSYDKALKYSTEACHKAENTNLLKEAGISHNLSGEILFATGMYADALKSYYTALQFSQKADYGRGESNALANLGKTYTQIGNFELASRFLMQAYNQYLEEDGEEGTGRVLTNLANLHLLTGDFDLAVSEYKQALGIKEKNNDQSGIAIALNNIGYAFLMQGLGDSALPYFEQSLRLKERLRDYKGQASTLNNIGALHLKSGNLSLAEAALNQAISIARRVNAREYLMEGLKLLSELNEKQGHKLESLEYHKEYSHLQNELYGIENNSKIAVLQTQYEIQQKEKELLESENNNKHLLLTQEKLRKRLLLAALLGALAIILIIAYRYTIVRRLLQLLKIREHQKEQLLKELNHRVKNNLQIVGSILRIQSRRLKDPAALKAIMEGHNRIEAMALVHKQLYTDSDSTEIDLHPFIERLVENLSLFNGQSGLSYLNEFGNVRIDAGKAMLIGLIVNELVSNAFKHNSSEEPQTRVFLLKGQANELLLRISDNGPGLEHLGDPDASGGFGLKLVRSFAEKLGGILSIDSDQGTTFSISIPGIKL